MGNHNGNGQMGMATKLTPAEFVMRAIRSLQKAPGNGIHSVFSHFNKAFRAYFPELDPVKEQERLVEGEVIFLRPARAGVIIYLFDERPEEFRKPKGPPMDPDAREVFKKMGLV